MSQTRADLDRKLARLSAKAHEMTPRRVARRLMPEYFWERVLGCTLFVTGSVMAWRRRPRRAHV